MKRPLKYFSPGAFVRGRFPPAIGAGILLALAFPQIGIAGFAWIAPGLMLAAAAGKRGGPAFRIGYVAGLTHNLVLLRWLLLIPFAWHGIPFGPAAGWFALSAYLALYPAVWVWLCAGVLAPRQARGGLKDFAKGILGAGWAWRMAWALGCAAIWVALEMTVARLMSGFPWNLLGVSQWRMTPLIQMASVTGVFGLSFVVVWTSVALLCASCAVVLESTNRHAWMREILVPLIVVLGLCMWGIQRIRQTPAPGRFLKIALVQPSIPQTLIWDASEDRRRFRDLLALSECVLTNKPDLLIWPESAIPKMVRYDQYTFDSVTGLAHSNRIWMIIGSDDAEMPAGTTNLAAELFFNSSFLVNRAGFLEDTYRKRNLVIFGEYVPLTHWMPFLKYFTPIDGGFTPGKTAGRYRLGDLHVSASMLVCFEDTFPGLARECVGPDTDFLVNLTNDGWFQEGAAQWEQMSTALFRAVENNVPLVRCSNNGLTCWIDAHGRLRDMLLDDSGSVYGTGAMVINLPLRSPGEALTPTFYNQHGDLFGWACVGISVGALVLARLRRWREREGAPRSR
jgi:apolipoprotein N-acyltransferase